MPTTSTQSTKSKATESAPYPLQKRLQIGKRFPIYFVAQVLGGFVGSGVVYANYINAINQVEGHGIRTVPPSKTATDRETISHLLRRASPRWFRRIRSRLCQLHQRNQPSRRPRNPHRTPFKNGYRSGNDFPSTSSRKS